MIARKAKYILFLLVMVMAGATVSSADCEYSTVLRTHLKRLRGMVIPIVAAMPEDKYDYRPTKDVRSFRELVEHMVSDIYTHMGYVAGKSKEQSDKIVAEKFPELKTRDQFLKALNEAYDYGDQVLAGLNDQNALETVTAMRGAHVTRVEAALQAFEDQMDHYGNFVVYLRINGIVPPDTAERQKQLREEKEKHQGMQGMPMGHDMDH